MLDKIDKFCVSQNISDPVLTNDISRMTEEFRDKIE